ncbi:hypothetical protein [Bradyrhizobium sp. CCBAU 53338]|uniref:hypothetical protein n=1 Tax=Bradyrhizobium sp. CCBAU 53338 TaxID=1325111 RepID=UPI00188A457F|nr:hypothetical protein [Bradyrhizobium sp. CCBAU 53338]QOZ51568.1 hypothetical protein XH90_09370 [Bradyrhizobium sp. CCBAU 53338]
MIRIDRKTETDLREAVRLATTYAADSFRAESIEEFDKIPREHFVARCHEGFSLAQDVILKNLLPLEEKLKALRGDIAKQSKGMKKREIQRDEVLQKLNAEEARLVWISNAFRRVADAMAWQILGMNKVLMRSTHTGGAGRGYLSDTNIASAIDAIAQLRKPGEFYLITDLTLSLGAGAGDLLQVRPDQSCGFVELKTGVQNARIFDFIHGFADQVEAQQEKIAKGEGPRSPEECSLHQYMDANIDLMTEKGKRKQIDRIFRQMERSLQVLDYERTGFARDKSSAKDGMRVERFAHVPETTEKYAFKEIGRALSGTAEQPPYFSFLHYGRVLTILVSDNLKSSTFARSLSPFVRTMNARHMIYHQINDNLPDCGHGKGPKEGAQEFITYSRLFVLDWATQVLCDGSLIPPFLMGFGSDLIFDVICGRKSIFVHFDRVAFAEFVTEAADGKFSVVPVKHVDGEWAGLKIKIAQRPGRKGDWTIGWGLILRMLIEFQDPETLRRHLVEMMTEREGRDETSLRPTDAVETDPGRNRET